LISPERVDNPNQIEIQSSYSQSLCSIIAFVKFVFFFLFRSCDGAKVKWFVASRVFKSLALNVCDHHHAQIYCIGVIYPPANDEERKTLFNSKNDHNGDSIVQ